MKTKNKRGLLIVMSGPSGVGKGTIRDLLMLDDSLKLFYSVSMTTRKQRPGEENGREYYFVSKAEFMKNVADENLIEWTEYVGNYYGTPKDKIEEMRNSGKNVLLEIEVKGASDVLRKIKDAISIYIAPPSFEELENRLKGRGTETEDVIRYRIATAKNELEYKDQYEFVVVNDERERCVDEIRKIIKERM